MGSGVVGRHCRVMSSSCLLVKCMWILGLRTCALCVDCRVVVVSVFRQGALAGQPASSRAFSWKRALCVSRDVRACRVWVSCASCVVCRVCVLTVVLSKRPGHALWCVRDRIRDIVE